MWNDLAAEIHEENDHWWNDPRDKNVLLLLIISEVIEAAESERRGGIPDKHLPHRSATEVELADTAIRLLDYARFFDHDLDTHMRRISGMHMMPPHEHPGVSLMRIIYWITFMGTDGDESEVFNLACTLSLIMEFAQSRGYDLLSAINEKRAYNRQRADHQPENRKQPGGKQW